MRSRAQKPVIRGDESFRIPEMLQMRELAGELVLLDPAMENYFGLNEVGARLMKLAANGSTFGNIVDGLASEYDVPREDLERDLKSLVMELIDAGLLERA